MKNYSLSSLWIVVIVLVVVTQLASCHGKKQNRDLPHIHRGVLSSFEAGPFDSIELDKNDEKVLDSGKPIMKMTQGEGDELGGSSICVQDVAAPKVRSGIAFRVFGRWLDLDLDWIGLARRSPGDHPTATTALFCSIRIS